MTQRSAIFHFPADLYDRPVVSRLVQEFDVEVNILNAHITPQQCGHMFAVLDGEEAAVHRALAAMQAMGVETILPVKNLVWNEDNCVHCGACAGPCRPGAFSVDPATRRVVFDPTRCIACNRCIPACSYGAIESVDDHLRRKEGTDEDL
jgi:ferredoxin